MINSVSCTSLLALSPELMAEYGLRSMRFWISRIKDWDTQSVQSFSASHSPKKTIIDPENGNILDFYDLSQLPGKSKTLEFSVLVDVCEFSPCSGPVDDSPDLDFITRFYTKSERGLELSDRVRGLSSSIVGQEKDASRGARRIFDYLVENFEYAVDIQACANLLRNKRGDCGDFSDAFVKLCRSQDIPARTVSGTLLPGEKNHQKVWDTFWKWQDERGFSEESVGYLLSHPGFHMWAEFFCPETGWIPVDAAMARIMEYHPNYRSSISKSNPRLARGGDFFFGNMDDQRLIYSKGNNIPLLQQSCPEIPLRNYYNRALWMQPHHLGNWFFSTFADTI